MKIFTCDLCKKEFPDDTPEEEALAELKEYFGDAPVEACGVVCDDCWQRIKPATIN